MICHHWILSLQEVFSSLYMSYCMYAYGGGGKCMDFISGIQFALSHSSPSSYIGSSGWVFAARPLFLCLWWTTTFQDYTTHQTSSQLWIEKPSIIHFRLDLCTPARERCQERETVLAAAVGGGSCVVLPIRKKNLDRTYLAQGQQRSLLHDIMSNRKWVPPSLRFLGLFFFCSVSSERLALEYSTTPVFVIFLVLSDIFPITNSPSQWGATAIVRFCFPAGRTCK